MVQSENGTRQRSGLREARKRARDALRRAEVEPPGRRPWGADFAPNGRPGFGPERSRP
jgi:hypothetical protein